MNRLTPNYLSILLLICLSSQLHAESWCRIDDPGPVESIRQAQEIENANIDTIACPEIMPADTYPEKLVLPMPCGRKMVFRRIDLHLAHLLDHQTGLFGKDYINDTEDTRNQRKIITEGAWKGSISGAFTQGDLTNGPLVRSYYVGAYEVTEAQYQLWQSNMLDEKVSSFQLSESKCIPHKEMLKKIVGTRVYPATEVAWIDAVNFANDYSAWLIRHDQRRIKRGLKPILPWESGASGFLRLPTEEEWEFAARGGDISASNSYNGLYAIENEVGSPTSPQLADVAFVLDAQSASQNDSVVYFVGRKKPNLSGLYDVIGNAEEIVFNLFQLVRPDGKLGQFGGYQVRGGNATMRARDLNVFSRDELPFFNQNGVLRRKTTGFRLVLSSPILMNARDDTYQVKLGNPELQEAIAESLKKLKDPKNNATGESIVQLSKLIDLLRSESHEGDYKLRQTHNRRDEIEQQLIKTTTKLNQREIELAEERLQASVLSLISQQTLGRSIKSALLVVKKSIYDVKEQKNNHSTHDVNFCNRIMGLAINSLNGIARTESISDTNFSQYMELIFKLANDSGQWLPRIENKVKAKFDRLKLKSKGLTGLTQLVVSHVNIVVSGGGSVSSDTLNEWRDRVDFELHERRALKEEVMQHPWITSMVKGDKSPCI